MRGRTASCFRAPASLPLNHRYHPRKLRHPWVRSQHRDDAVVPTVERDLEGVAAVDCRINSRVREEGGHNGGVACISCRKECLLLATRCWIHTRVRQQESHHTGMSQCSS